LDSLSAESNLFKCIIGFDGTGPFFLDPRASALSPDKGSGSEEDGAASGGHSDVADGHESVRCEESRLFSQKTEQES